MNNNQYTLSKEEQHNSNLCGCYFHPKEGIVGVCALCLKEKLLTLASKQGHTDNLASLKSHHQFHINKKSILKVVPSKIFTDLWGNSFSFLHRRRRCHSSEFQNHESKNSDDIENDDNDDEDTSTSQEDSFISIKFQDNGVASWDRGTTNYNKVSSLDQPCFNNNILSTNAATNNKTNYNNTNKELMISTTDPINTKEGPNTKTVVEHVNTHVTLRWRKRIGQILQIIKWNRSTKANVRHVVNKVDGVKIRKSWIRSLTKRRRRSMNG